MFYFLSKTFDVLVMPLTLALLAILYSIFTKNHARKRKVLWSVVVFLYLVSNPLLVNQLVRWWEGALPPTITQPYEVGVVLTGGMTKLYQSQTKHFWMGDVADRAVQAFELYKEGKIKKILISGGQGNLRGTAKGPSESDGVKQYLILSGVNPADIIQEAKSRNTRENALFSAKILREQFRTDRCVVITSAFHLRRSVACFKKAGIEVLPHSAQYLQEDLVVWFDQFFPSEQALESFYTIWHEMVGYAIYRVMGYA
jgi:uncharacterized SAM-binding protein YcdF (DUF218 family)